MRISLFISMLLVTGTLFARNLDKTFQLLPQPQSIEVLAVSYTHLTLPTICSV